MPPQFLRAAFVFPDQVAKAAACAFWGKTMIAFALPS